VDIGVHSLKDTPVQLAQGVQLGACLPRDDPRDALISLKARTLGEL
jgi:hydroxymethylbilane synthase